MVRVVVDYERCEGHGMCEQAAPQEFRLDDEGELHLRHTEVPPALVPAVQAAVRVCPVAALAVEQ